MTERGLSLIVPARNLLLVCGALTWPGDAIGHITFSGPRQSIEILFSSHCQILYYWLCCVTLSIRFTCTFCLLQLAKDLLHPTPEEEKRRHKKKRLVQSPNSYFMDVKCPGESKPLYSLVCVQYFNVGLDCLVVGWPVLPGLSLESK